MAARLSLKTDINGWDLNRLKNVSCPRCSSDFFIDLSEMTIFGDSGPIQPLGSLEVQSLQKQEFKVCRFELSCSLCEWRDFWEVSLVGFEPLNPYLEDFIQMENGAYWKKKRQPTKKKMLRKKTPPFSGLSAQIEEEMFNPPFSGLSAQIEEEMFSPRQYLTGSCPICNRGSSLYYTDSQIWREMPSFPNIPPFVKISPFKPKRLKPSAKPKKPTIKEDYSKLGIRKISKQT